MNSKLKLILLWCFTVSASFAVGQSLTGKWAGKSEGELITMIFDSEGYASMGAEGTELGGKKFTIEGKYFYMKYTLKKEGKFWNLDLVIYNYQTHQEIQRMLCIVDWISTNQIKLCMGMDETGKRPKDFSNKEDTVVLTRK